MTMVLASLETGAACFQKRIKKKKAWNSGAQVGPDWSDHIAFKQKQMQEAQKWCISDLEVFRGDAKALRSGVVDVDFHFPTGSMPEFVTVSL